MPRKKTKPPLSAVKLEQQRLRKLRKAWKGHSATVPGICDLLISQLNNLPWMIEAGEVKKAAKMRSDMALALKALDAAIKRNAQ